jgi:hypothetical protein
LAHFIIQIALGSFCLLISALIHVAVFAIGIPKIAWLGVVTQSVRMIWRTALLLSAGVGLLIVAHTCTIWFWAIGLYGSGAFTEFATSFYFSTVTYTTLGYGDVVLDPAFRIFGSFAAITGLLTFGLSTAFLVGLLVRILPDLLHDDHDPDAAED